MNDGIIGSMKELGVTESYKLKRQVVLSASEAAEMIIRYVLQNHHCSKYTYRCYFLGLTISLGLHHGNVKQYSRVSRPMDLHAETVLDTNEINNIICFSRLRILR